MIENLLIGFNIFVLVYFAVLNIFYLTTTAVSYVGLRRHVARLKALAFDDLLTGSSGLPISLLVPGFNEAATIVESTRSFLTLAYPEYEVVVVNDGSTDETLQALIEAFDLRRGSRLPTSDIPTSPVRGVYRSAVHPHLWVVDKENGGKADALNAGVNYSRNPLFCAMDADTLLEPDALDRVVRPFLEDQRTIAAGGIVRIANGCRVEGGTVESVQLPTGLLARFQVLEYLRAFLAGRVAWDVLNATMIVSGAFGVFRRSVVADVGGFATDTVGEDMELVVRLHRRHREQKQPYRITFIPDPVAWTEAPESLRSLAGQRNRWQRGLAQVLVRHRSMLARPRYGTVGMLAFPYYVMFELAGPVIEALGYLVFAISLIWGVASPAIIVAFLALAVFLGSAISVGAVALEEMSFKRYQRRRDLIVLLGLALIESFGYRQLTTIWRLQGLIAAARGVSTWGAMQRQGFSEPTGPQEQPEVPTTVGAAAGD